MQRSTRLSFTITLFQTNRKPNCHVRQWVLAQGSRLKVIQMIVQASLPPSTLVASFRPTVSHPCHSMSGLIFISSDSYLQNIITSTSLKYLLSHSPHFFPGHKSYQVLLFNMKKNKPELSIKIWHVVKWMLTVPKNEQSCKPTLSCAAFIWPLPETINHLS